MKYLIGGCQFGRRQKSSGKQNLNVTFAKVEDVMINWSVAKINTCVTWGLFSKNHFNSLCLLLEIPPEKPSNHTSKSPTSYHCNMVKPILVAARWFDNSSEQTWEETAFVFLSGPSLPQAKMEQHFKLWWNYTLWEMRSSVEMPSPHCRII